MGLKGRRPISGVQRTPSGAISRSKTSLAKRDAGRREAAREAARREARVGRTLQQRTQEARQRVFGLTATQAASHHAATAEGRIYLRGHITAREMLALEHYGRTLARFARAVESPRIGPGALAAFQPSEGRVMCSEPSGAATILARRRYDAVRYALDLAGEKAGFSAAWAVDRVCREQQDLQPHQMAAFKLGAAALVVHYGLGPDPDRPTKEVE